MAKLDFKYWPFVIGMVHLGPLPGAPGFTGNFDALLQFARRDAQYLAQGGVDAIMIENFGDIPFARERVSAETIAAMAVAVSTVAQVTSLPLGVNVLRNDGLSALAIAVATNARFIRVNVLASARVTDQGIIQGIAYELLRERERLRAHELAILADIDVKHSAPLATSNLALEAEELALRAGANGLIVTGSTTGRPVSSDSLNTLSKHVSIPLIVGSGVNVDTIASFATRVDGFIVGTSLKEEGQLERPVDPARVEALMAALAPHRKSK